MKKTQVNGIIRVLKNKNNSHREVLHYAYVDKKCMMYATDGYIMSKQYIGSVPYETEPEMENEYSLHYDELEKYTKLAKGKEEFMQTTPTQYGMKNGEDINHPDFNGLLKGIENQETRGEISFKVKTLKQALAILDDDENVKIEIKDTAILMTQNDHDEVVAMGLIKR